MQGMGSSQPSLITKEFVRVKVTTANVTSIKVLGDRMGNLQRQRFSSVYGNILKVALTEVPPNAIYSLVQYYDQPLRCFTFKDFQLAPTLEEFEKILGLPIGDRRPYVVSGHPSPVSRVAEVIRITEIELTSKLIIRNGIKGIPRDYLEKRAHTLADKKEWEPFIDILALLIFGVVLFPQIGGLIGWAAINAFLVFLHRRESPVTALLGDLYLAFDQSYTIKDSRVFGCLPALYTWLVISTSVHGARPNCPWEDFHLCEGHREMDWGLHLAGLTAMKIRWRQRWREVPSIIHRCGDFPNVPLAGTRGCINYNPILAWRQFGYPIRGPPSDLALTPLVARGLDLEHLLPQIAKAWLHPIRGGAEVGKGKISARGSYEQWITTRVQQIGLPRLRPRLDTSPQEETARSDNEEFVQMKVKLRRIEAKNLVLEREAESARREHKMWQEMAASITQALETAQSRENQGTEQIREYQTQLAQIVQERDEAREECLELKGQLTEAWEARMDLRDQLEKIELRMLQAIQRQEEQVIRERQALAVTHGRALREQQTRVLELEAQAQMNDMQMARAEEKIRRKEEEIANLRAEGKLWMERFGTVLRGSEHLPEVAQKAEEMADIFSTPVEIHELFRYCRHMIELMTSIIRNR